MSPTDSQACGDPTAYCALQRLLLGYRYFPIMALNRFTLSEASFETLPREAIIRYMVEDPVFHTIRESLLRAKTHFGSPLWDDMANDMFPLLAGIPRESRARLLLVCDVGLSAWRQNLNGNGAMEVQANTLIYRVKEREQNAD